MEKRNLPEFYFNFTNLQMTSNLGTKVLHFSSLGKIIFLPFKADILKVFKNIIGPGAIYFVCLRRAALSVPIEKDFTFSFL